MNDEPTPEIEELISTLQKAQSEGFTRVQVDADGVIVPPCPRTEGDDTVIL